jgi:hypothetical protein
LATQVAIKTATKPAVARIPGPLPNLATAKTCLLFVIWWRLGYPRPNGCRSGMPPRCLLDRRVSRFKLIFYLNFY